MKAEEILVEARRDRSAKLKVSPFINPNPPGELYWWQHVQALHICGRKSHCVGDLTGLGKTAAILTAYAVLKTIYPKLLLWVIATKSACVTWSEEVPLWTQGLKWDKAPSESIVLSSLPKFERYEWRGLSGTDYRNKVAYTPWKDGGDILISNYVQARLDREVILHGVPKENLMVVTDEATAYKGEDTDTRDAIEKIRRVADRFYAVTATIVKNGLEEANSIMNVLAPGICSSLMFELYFCVFKDVWIKRVTRGGGRRKAKVKKRVGYKSIDDFKKMIEPYYLGYRDDEPDIAAILPTLEHKMVHVPLPNAHAAIYNAIEKMLIDPTWGKELTPLTKFMYGQFFLNAPSSLVAKERFPSIEKKLASVAKKTPPKLETLVDLLESELKDDKVLVYTHYETFVTIIVKELESRGYACARVTGEESDSERAAAKAGLNSGKVQILVIDDAGGESLNLQAARALVFYDLPWSAGDYAQVIGRIRRLNTSDRMKLVYHLIVPNSVDAYKWDVLDAKFEIMERLYKGKGSLMNVGTPITPEEILAKARKIGSTT